MRAAATALLGMRHAKTSWQQQAIAAAEGHDAETVCEAVCWF
jgi:hypothetical protein